jgi:hypothetical protein
MDAVSFTATITVSSAGAFTYARFAYAVGARTANLAGVIWW